MIDGFNLWLLCVWCIGMVIVAQTSLHAVALTNLVLMVTIAVAIA
jgi:hypothetical protein